MRKIRKITADGSRPRTQRGEEQKKKLVDAAYDIIAEHGFEGLRTREVARRARLNISTLHYYFTTKEDLVRSVAERLLLEFKAVPEQPAAPLGPMERLRREFTSQWHVIKTNPATYVVVIELFARSIRDAQLRPVARQLLASWEKHLDEHVADGIARGEIAPASGQGPTVTALQCMLLGRALTLLISGGGGSQESLFARVSRWLSSRD